MAYIVSTLQTASASGAATYAVNFPPDVLANDLLVVLLSQDGSTESLAVAASGFTALGTQVESGACSGLPFFKIAAGGETSATFACSTSAIIGTAILIRDAHATTPFGSVTDAVDYKRADWNSANFADSPNGAGALTTAVDECLLLYAWNSDGNLPYMRCKLAEVTGLDRHQTAAINHIIGYRQQQAAGVAPTVRMYHSTAVEGGNGWVLAVRNKSGGALQPDIRPTITELKWFGSWETQQDGITWQAPSNFSVLTAGAFTIGNKYTIVSVGTTDFTLIGASANTIGVQFTATGAGTGTGTAGEAINAILTTGTAPTVAVNVFPANDDSYGAGTSLASTESTAGALVGGTFTITSEDMTGKIFGVQWARNAASSVALQGSAGILVGFSDGTNWAVYQLSTQDKGWIANSDLTAFVAVGQATAYATSGSINWAAVTRLGFFVHRVGSVTTSSYLLIKNAALFGNTALTGGGALRPASWTDYQSAMNSWGTLNWADLQGSAQVKPKSSVQIGDGTNKTYFDGATNAIGYPQAWSATSNSNWQMDWNVNAGQVTLGVRASANDTIKLAAGAATSANAQLLTIASDSNSGATYDFAQAFGGFTATWDTDIPAIGATFTGGGQFAGKGADFTNCTWKNSTAGTTAAVLGFDANGAVLDGCTTVATTATGYHIELGTSVTAFTLTDHTFSGSALTDKVHVLKTLTNVAAGAFVVGVHYRINTVGTTDFTAIGASANTIGVNFTATGVGTGTGTADEAVKITISGSTSLAETDVTTAGAPAWVAAPQPTLDATVLANTRAVLWNRTASSELDNTFVAGTTWSKTITSGASANDVLDLYLFKEGYEESVSTIIYSGDDATFATSQATDDAIQYYRTTESVTDYTTLTEYNFYAPDIYIQADDGDGENTLKRMFIFYNGVLTTEDGARYMRGGVTFRSPFDVVINRSVRAIAVDNVSVTHGLHFTDEDVIRVTTDDGTSWIAPPSAPGSIRYAFGVSPGQVTITTSDSVVTGTLAEFIAAVPTANEVAQEVVNGITF